MSKVLLIEPHRVLQQALVLSLFPEHDVRVEASSDAAVIGALKDFDLLIIDAAALRTAGKLTAEFQRAVEAVKTPTLWIDDDAAPKRANVAALTPPIASASLQTAVADLLSDDPKRTKKNSQRETSDAIETAQEAAAEPIDLVEVVEDDSQD